MARISASSRAKTTKTCQNSSCRNANGIPVERPRASDRARASGQATPKRSISVTIPTIMLRHASDDIRCTGIPASAAKVRRYCVLPASVRKGAGRPSTAAPHGSMLAP
jgi:hypothetical protein